MLKKLAFDFNDGFYCIENGQLRYISKPIIRLEQNQVIIRPDMRNFYYDEDSYGFCRKISQSEYEQALSAETTVEIVEGDIITNLPSYPPSADLPVCDVTNTSYTPHYGYVANYYDTTAVPINTLASPIIQPQFTQQNLFANIAEKVVKCDSTEEKSDEGDVVTGIDGNFSVRLEERKHYIIKTLDGYKDEVSLRFTISYPNGIVTKEIAGFQATDPKWVSTATAFKAHLNPGKKSTDAFVRHMQQLMADATVPETFTYASSGWESFAGHRGYLHADGVIGVNIPYVRGDKTFKICYDTEQVGKQETFLVTLKILEITRNTAIMSVLYLFVHTGILTSLFEEARFPVKFIVAILGLTNSKKTSLALATLRLFNTDTTSPDISFTSTAGGIEVFMAKYADAILIIDDLMPATNKSHQNQIDDKFDNISRASGDRTTKKRMTDFSPNGAKIEYPIRGCYAITGEQLHGVQSAESRTVVIKLQKNDVINDNLRFFQDNYQLLPTQLVDFIRYVADHYDQIVTFIHEKLPFYRQMLTVKTPRLAEAFAVLMVTKDILFAYIRERGFMNEGDLSILNNHLFEGAKTVILSNDRENATKDPGILCLTALSDAIATKSIHLINRINYREKDDVILEDETFFFVRTETMFLIAKNYCTKYDTPIALVNPKAVIPALEQIGVLDFSKERSRKLPDNSFDSRRYLYIKKDTMKKILEQTEQEVF